MIIFISCALLILLVLVYSFIENRFIKTCRYFVYLDSDGVKLLDGMSKEASDSLSIVQLSDLHNCSYGKSNECLINKIELCQPDLIFLTGDMINKNKNIPEKQMLFFERLSKICPCIYSLGNHELQERNRYPERYFRYIETMKKYGIIVSDNESISVTVNGISCSIAAYSSDLEFYKLKKSDFAVALSGIILAECDDSDVKILLSHDPDLAELYKKSEYPLVFSGHLHGGIVRIPGYRGVVSTRFSLFPKYDGGYYQLDKKHAMIVSRGLGTHTIKFRLFNRPELVHTFVMK